MSAAHTGLKSSDLTVDQAAVAGQNPCRKAWPRDDRADEVRRFWNHDYRTGPNPARATNLEPRASDDELDVRIDATPDDDSTDELDEIFDDGGEA